MASFLALAIAGLTSQDAQLVRAGYLAMELTTWLVIVPLSLASFLSGLVQGLGTPWGLFRHYWVLAKLLLTVLATIILLVHTQPIGYVAEVAAATTLSGTDLRQLRIQLVADAGAALLALLVTTTLSVYKPWGLTPYGWRKQPAGVPDRGSNTSPVWGRLLLLGIVGLLLRVSHHSAPHRPRPGGALSDLGDTYVSLAPVAAGALERHARLRFHEGAAR